MHRRRSGKENESIDCVQSGIQAFGIAGDLKMTVLKSQVCVETVTTGGWRLWLCGRTIRQTLLDIVSRRERQRDWKSHYLTQRRMYSLQTDTSWLSRPGEGTLFEGEMDQDLRRYSRWIT